MSDQRDWFTWTPTVATEAACRFYSQHARDMQYAASAGLIFEQYEMLVRSIGSTFSDVAPDGDPEKLFPEFYAQSRRMKETVEKLTPVSAEFGVTRSVENFLVYVSDVISEVLTVCPHLLKSQEQVTLEDVLQHGTIADFVSWAAEKRVAQLSFQGLDDIAHYVTKRLGLNLHQDEDDWVSLKKGVQLRNLIVHRRSRVDERFIRLTGEKGLVRGSSYSTAMPDYVRTARSAMKIVSEFDARVAHKFPVEQRSTVDEDWYSEGRWGPDGRKAESGPNTPSV
ncbi:hypothetical protein [Streptomyces rubiginosohelvolus]|uniref:hypothetical protein n=1 Tax=Streptomyces rubiginosohelvolus TaxID=67362 RepID=UPI0035D574AC